MDLRFTEAQLKLRSEIRHFLAQELTPEFRERLAASGNEDSSPEFSRKLGQKGWIGLAWPREFGGQKSGPFERLIYIEEMWLHSAPIRYHHPAERQMAPSIIQWGTKAQQDFFLPRIARGECGIAMGYSEPNVGSDLASVETHAVEDGDDFIINGTKIWNGAHRMDYIWLATRTDLGAPKHKGISVFLVNMKTPGIAIRPIENMAGEPEFCEVYFDNVRVPRAALVGEKNRGWYVITGNLDMERSGVDRLNRNYPLFQQVLGYFREEGQQRVSPDQRMVLRRQIAEMETEYEVGRMLCYRVAWLQTQGADVTRATSIAWLFGAEVAMRMAYLAMQLLGLHGQLRSGSRHAVLQGKAERALLYSIPLTIAGGTSEIQRNIIAVRGLGLPRD